MKRFVPVLLLVVLMSSQPVVAQTNAAIIWQGEVRGTFGAANAGPGFGVVTDGELVLASGFANGPLHVWERYGAPLLGWGIFAESHGAGYATLDDFVTSNPGNEIFAGYYLDANEPSNGVKLGVFDPYSGQPMGAVITLTDTYVDNPPTSLVWWNGKKAVCLGLHGSGLRCFEATTMIELVRFTTPTSQPEVQTPVVIDVDSDGQLELFFITTTDDFGEIRLYGVKQSGVVLTGYPVIWTGGVDTPLVAADLDNNNQIELVSTELSPATDPYDRQLSLKIIQANNGQVLISHQTGITDPDGGALALGEWDNDQRIEVVLQGHQQLTTFNWNGTNVTTKPGWEGVMTGWRDWSSPVIGDVDHDQEIEVVTEYRTATGSFLAVYSQTGSRELEMALDLGIAGAPAITIENKQAFVYARGVHIPPHNNFSATDVIKVVINSQPTRPSAGMQWSQYMGNPAHTGQPTILRLVYIPMIRR